MRIDPTSAIALYLVLAVCAAHAEATPKGKAAVPRIDCAAATDGPELTHCAEIRLKKADSDLATVLDKVKGQIGKRAGANTDERTRWATALDAAHTAWIAYREADCRELVPFEWKSGTGASLAVLECMAQMTEQRGFELTERYADGR